MLAGKSYIVLAKNIPEGLHALFDPSKYPDGIIKTEFNATNARGGPDEADNVRDHRGLAIRIPGPDGKPLQDFLFNSGGHGTSFVAQTTGIAMAAQQVASIEGFKNILAKVGALAGLVRAFEQDPLVRKKGFPRKLHALQATRALVKRLKAGDDEGKSYASYSFGAGMPFEIGEGADRQLIWVHLTPYPETGDPTLLGGAGHNELRDDLQLRHERGPIKWKIEVEGWNGSSDLANATTVWGGERIHVADHVIPTKRASENVASNIETAQKRRGFSTSNNALMKGFGPLAFLREVAYETSSKGRGCPLGYG